MKLMNKLKERKANNKGFSLVELIIVIAIMAILVGIVGTQVVPYLNRSKESKDLQLVNSYSTAAMTACSTYAEKMPSGDFTIADVYTTETDEFKKLVQTEIIKLTGYDDLTDLTDKMTSSAKDKITKIEVKYDSAKKSLITRAVDSTGKTVLEEVKADM